MERDDGEEADGFAQDREDDADGDEDGGGGAAAQDVDRDQLEAVARPAAVAQQALDVPKAGQAAAGAERQQQPVRDAGSHEAGDGAAGGQDDRAEHRQQAGAAGPGQALLGDGGIAGGEAAQAVPGGADGEQRGEKDNQEVRHPLGLNSKRGRGFCWTALRVPYSWASTACRTASSSAAGSGTRPRSAMKPSSPRASSLR